jgi:hypothetical protein
MHKLTAKLNEWVAEVEKQVQAIEGKLKGKI